MPHIFNHNRGGAGMLRKMPQKSFKKDTDVNNPFDNESLKELYVKKAKELSIH
jgi:hypothetical protein